MLKKQQESARIIVSPVVTGGYGKQGTYTAYSQPFGDQDRACSALHLLCGCSTCNVEEGLLPQVGSTLSYCLAGWATTIMLEALGCWSCGVWSWLRLALCLQHALATAGVYHLSSLLSLFSSLHYFFSWQSRCHWMLNMQLWPFCCVNADAPFTTLHELVGCLLDPHLSEIILDLYLGGYQF